MLLILVRIVLNRCITGGPISLLKKCINAIFGPCKTTCRWPYQFQLQGRVFRCFGAWCFIVFSPNHKFYNDSCPPLEGAMKTSAHGVRACDVFFFIFFESNVHLLFFIHTWKQHCKKSKTLNKHSTNVDSKYVGLFYFEFPWCTIGSDSVNSDSASFLVGNTENFRTHRTDIQCFKARCV